MSYLLVLWNRADDIYYPSPIESEKDFSFSILKYHKIQLQILDMSKAKKLERAFSR
jgi:hypothetical protein